MRGVIFDVDGVLADSEPFTHEAIIHLFAEKGVTIRYEDIDPFMGTGELRMLQGVAERYGVAIDPARDLARVEALYLEGIRGRLRPEPGAADFVARCRQRGWKLAVASSGSAAKVDANLRELGLHSFDAIITGSQAARKKPDPEIYLLAARALQLPPSQCLVIEDAVAGVAAAKAAGARCLALTTSFPADHLQQADWIVPDLAHVPAEVFEW
jgi:beta-phosphoglucomutase